MCLRYLLQSSPPCVGRQTTGHRQVIAFHFGCRKTCEKAGLLGGATFQIIRGTVVTQLAISGPLFQNSQLPPDML